MKPYKKPETKEKVIRQRIIDYLTLRKWHVMITHGNAFQQGLPDLYAAHRSYGQRWIEVKRPRVGRLTTAQHDMFYQFARRNVGVWILDGPDEYDRLFGAPNWHSYITVGAPLNVPQERLPIKGPEGVIQREVINELTRSCNCPEPLTCTKHDTNNWFVVEMYGNAFSSGFPDLYCCHKMFGTRFIECKNQIRYEFTPKQLATFPELSLRQIGVWIVTDVSQLRVIYGRPNWQEYIK